MRYGRMFWVGALVVALAGISVPSASAAGIRAIQGPAAVQGPGTVTVKKHKRPHVRRHRHRRHHRKVKGITLHAPSI